MVWEAFKTTLRGVILSWVNYRKENWIKERQELLEQIVDLEDGQKAGEDQVRSSKSRIDRVNSGKVKGEHIWWNCAVVMKFWSMVQEEIRLMLKREVWLLAHLILLRNWSDWNQGCQEP